MYKRVAQAVVSWTLLMAVMAGTAQADLVVIGTADINGVGTGYNLIYDAAAPFGSIVWLDYTTPSDLIWDNQVAWTNGLNTLGSVTYHLNSGIDMNWSGGWRLPGTIDAIGSSGFNKTTSEMGHLYYTELVLTANGGGVSVAEAPFVNIASNYFWSGTQYASDTSYAWTFATSTGNQVISATNNGYRAISVRSGTLVSTVPEPSTYLLLGISLGVVGFVRRKISAR